MRRLVCFFGYVTIISSLYSISSYSLDPAFLQKVKAEEQLAYDEICSGKGRDGLKSLVYLFREMPADDVQCADILGHQVVGGDGNIILDNKIIIKGMGLW